MATIVLAAAVASLIALPVATWAIAVAGAAVVLLLGIDQLNDFRGQWTRYRTTAETLRRERTLYLARAGPYSTDVTATATLAERVEELLAAETSSWAKARSGAS